MGIGNQLALQEEENGTSGWINSLSQEQAWIGFLVLFLDRTGPGLGRFCGLRKRFKHCTRNSTHTRRVEESFVTLVIVLHGWKLYFTKFLAPFVRRLVRPRRSIQALHLQTGIRIPLLTVLLLMSHTESNALPQSCAFLIDVHWVRASEWWDARIS